jgi:hypothetical protein
MSSLYFTIWLGLALFVAGETGRSLARRSPPPAWAWWTFTLGAILAIVHTMLAFHVVHDWVHDDAVRNTRLQTLAVYGVDVPWGIYVNYLFLAIWAADAWAWASGRLLSPRVLWSLRAFYAVIIVNAAVIFAAGSRRGLGIAVITWLVVIWIKETVARQGRELSNG